MDWQRDVSDATEFVEGIKLDIFQDQVFVFTPKGDIKDLPAGATPLDFAYRIHTDVGHRTIGAKVNNRLVPLDYRLKNGDIVEIVTTKAEHGPSRDWLNVVRTCHAREKIRQWFKRQERDENIVHGRESLDRELRRLARTSIQAVGAGQDRRGRPSSYNYDTLDDFYAAIGYGAISAQQVVMRLGVVDDTELGAADGRAADQPARTGGVRVKGVGDLLVRFAKCCHPIPGDPIVGFITRGKGVTVHLRICPTVLNEREVTRLIEVEWEAAPAQTYPIAIRVEAYDRTGPAQRHHPGRRRGQGQHPRRGRLRQPGPHRDRHRDAPGRLGGPARPGHEPDRAAQGRHQRPARPRLDARRRRQLRRAASARSAPVDAGIAGRHRRPRRQPASSARIRRMRRTRYRPHARTGRAWHRRSSSRSRSGASTRRGGWTWRDRSRGESRLEATARSYRLIGLTGAPRLGHLVGRCRRASPIAAASGHVVGAPSGQDPGCDRRTLSGRPSRPLARLRAMPTFRAPRGTRDLLPAERATFARLERIAARPRRRATATARSRRRCSSRPRSSSAASARSPTSSRRSCSGSQPRTEEGERWALRPEPTAGHRPRLRPARDADAGRSR